MYVNRGKVVMVRSSTRVTCVIVYVRHRINISFEKGESYEQKETSDLCFHVSPA